MTQDPTGQNPFIITVKLLSFLDKTRRFRDEIKPLLKQCGAWHPVPGTRPHVPELEPRVVSALNRVTLAVTRPGTGREFGPSAPEFNAGIDQIRANVDNVLGRLEAAKPRENGSAVWRLKAVADSLRAVLDELRAAGANITVQSKMVDSFWDFDPMITYRQRIEIPATRDLQLVERVLDLLRDQESF